MLKKKKKKEAELQVIKQSPLGYCHFTGEKLIFGEKEDSDLLLKKKKERKNRSKTNWKWKLGQTFWCS